MNSSASRPVRMPPKPTTGMLTAPTACQTIRSAMGRTAGPESPAKTLLNTGRRFSRSTAQAWKVLHRLMPSAPAASTALHISGMLSACGLSLTTSGTVQTLRTALTTSSASLARMPNARPPCLTLGQLMFSSRISTPAAQSFCTPSTFSSMVCPPRFAHTVVPQRRMAGSSQSIKCCTPGFCSPMEFISPDGVSYRRSPSLPGCPCRVSPLPEMPPSRRRSSISAYSGPKPKVPDAATTGPARRLPKKSTCRSAISQTPPVRGIPDRPCRR